MADPAGGRIVRGLAGRTAGDGPQLKSADEIAAISLAAEAAWCVLREAADACLEGVTSLDVDGVVRRAITRRGAEALFPGVVQGDSPPFPAAACISINEEAVHGVPGNRIVRAGDVVSIDVGLRLNGWCAECATTLMIDGKGQSEDEQRRLLVIESRAILAAAVSMMRPGVLWSAVAMMIERRAAAAGYGIVTEYVGHGVGRDLHEPPRAPAYWSGFDGEDFVLESGMVIAIEPILTIPASADRSERGFIRTPVRLMADGWTVVTADGGCAAHEERMVAVTECGAMVLGGE